MKHYPSFDLMEVLLAAVEERSFLEAGRRLGLSQGAVSLKVKALEAQIGSPLFLLRGRKKVPTPYGREVAGYARRQVDQARQDFETLHRRYSSPEKMTVSVGCRRELLEELLPRAAFKGKILHRHLSGHDALAAVLDRKIDIAIGYDRPDQTDFMARKVLVSRPQLVVHRKWLRSGDTKSFFEDLDFLANTPCLLYDEKGHLLEDWVTHLGLPFEQLKAIRVTDDWRTLQTLVDRGEGYAVVPNYVHSRNKQVIARLLPEAVFPRFHFFAVYHRDLLKVPALKELLRSLGDSKPEVVKLSHTVGLGP